MRDATVQPSVEPSRSSAGRRRCQARVARKSSSASTPRPSSAGRRARLGRLLAHRTRREVPDACEGVQLPPGSAARLAHAGRWHVQRHDHHRWRSPRHRLRRPHLGSRLRRLVLRALRALRHERGDRPVRGARPRGGRSRRPPRTTQRCGTDARRRRAGTPFVTENPPSEAWRPSIGARPTPATGTAGPWALRPGQELTRVERRTGWALRPFRNSELGARLSADQPLRQLAIRRAAAGLARTRRCRPAKSR